ncbi:family 78 glycoside hydrolase catalytic domain [Luteolibacter marinus]|uniref:family 78 glycoside hydrolase catalytic domain n=1 Tax=Luteolibacter marinus TaxID=2776705 RepID=UPI001868C3B0|nr:family 78 glycoside hydrolase catalytic domain [Luteolibacter marinus]
MPSIASGSLFRRFLPAALSSLLGLLTADGALEVDQLRCEYLTDPRGIDETSPRLSWIVKSLERGENQSAWQVLVAATPEELAAGQGTLWDSGKVAGDATSQIVYAGTALSSRDVCHWKVRSWNQDDMPSEWSAPASWSMGLLEASDWTAKWIDGQRSVPASSGAEAPLLISASYRAVDGSASADVLGLLTELAAEGNHALPVTNETFGGDPAYNKLKELRVEYQLGGQTLVKTFAEDALVVFPADLQAAPEPVITGARYESVAGGGFRDVTGVLAGLDQGEPYSVVVNNTNFGPDPAVNQVKRLRVEYEVNGVSGVAFTAEQATFHFPADLPELLPVTLTAATYGAIDGSGANDVLANLNARATAGAFTMVASNGNLGGDPTPNKVKRLRIEYELNGRALVKYVDENATLRFPGDLKSPTNVPYLRKGFAVTKPVARATVYATALGLYELSLNGQRVGDHTLAPEWTDYGSRLRYQAYDVTGALADGENVLGAQLAHGWYSGHIGNGGYQYWGVSPALLAQLEITYQDGTTQTVVSDGSWKSGESPTLYTDFMFGEEYDARREVPGWNEPGFDDSGWASVLLRPEPEHRLVGQVMEPSREVMQLTPVSLTEPAPGKWTYDLGQNMVGVLRIKVTAAAGTRVTLRHGERLNTDGTLYTANLRGAPSIDTYICKGGGEETWQPKFTFHGFQYFEITGLAAAPPVGDVSGIVIASDTPRTGELTTSDGVINRLQSNIEWGQRGNYLSVPTDCPQRDERLGWMGDAQVFVRTATYNADVAAFFTKWMTDVRDSQLASGAFADVAPFAGPSTGTPAWGDAGVICPWTIYQAYGDTRILEECYDSMVAWVEWCRSNTTNSIRDRARGSDYGDWLSINADTDKELLGTAYYAYSTKLLANTAEILGKTADAATYGNLFETIRSAFAAKYVNPTTGAMTGGTQCAYLLGLKFDLIPANLREAAVQHLVDDIVARGNHLSTGFVGVGYLLPVLTEAGRTDVAYQLLHQDTFPSWLFSIKHGATTIWERWDGWTPEAGFQSTIMNSFNHYSLGSCGEWLYSTVAGIDLDPEGPGYKKIIIRPRPGGNLDSARGSLKSIHGLITSSWRTHDGGFSLETTIPANTSATVYVPATAESEVMESGQAASTADSVTFLRMEDGAAVFHVESGRYHFTTGTTPAPGDDTVMRDPLAPVKIRIATLLGNDGDGPFELFSVGPLSVQGGSVEIIDGWVHYTPAPGVTGPDTFSYVIRDEQGGVSTRTVEIGIIPEDAAVQYTLTFERSPDGSCRVVFAGIPGRIYQVQSSDQLEGGAGWVNRAGIQADEDGMFEFIDTPPLPAARFYRATFP